jgi:hypothetical protein
MVVVPATLTPAMCTVIEFKDINMATDTLLAVFPEVCLPRRTNASMQQ